VEATINTGGKRILPNGATEKRILPALLLCFFFGAMGFHRFYVGKIVSGIFMAGITISLLTVYLTAATRTEPTFAVALIAGYFFWFSVGSAMWVITDFVRLIIGAFKDKSGARLSQWV
jgi:TM2 domain